MGRGTPDGSSVSPGFSGRPTTANWVAHVTGGQVFRAVATALGAASIPVLPVKGLVTAHRLYEDAASRPIRDVDVRLRRRDFAQATRIARACGWGVRPVALLGQAVWRVEGMEVDVKCALGPPGLCATTVEDVMARAESRVDPLGVAHLEPECNDHALLLVLNVFKDGLRSTPWAVEDLRRIGRHERFDAGTLVERARAGRVATALWILAGWLADEQGAPGWRAVKERIGARPPSARAAATYALWRRAGSPRRVGHFVVPSLGDDAWLGAVGLGLATAGLARGYGLRAIDALAARRKPG
jgi:hypothetical protein